MVAETWIEEKQEKGTSIPWDLTKKGAETKNVERLLSELFHQSEKFEAKQMKNGYPAHIKPDEPVIS